MVAGKLILLLLPSAYGWHSFIIVHRHCELFIEVSAVIKFLYFLCLH